MKIFFLVGWKLTIDNDISLLNWLVDQLLAGQTGSMNQPLVKAGYVTLFDGHCQKIGDGDTPVFIEGISRCQEK